MSAIVTLFNNEFNKPNYKYVINSGSKGYEIAPINLAQKVYDYYKCTNVINGDIEFVEVQLPITGEFYEFDIDGNGQMFVPKRVEEISVNMGHIE